MTEDGSAGVIPTVIPSSSGAQEPQDLRRLIWRPEDRPADDHRAHRVQLELERRDDPEVAVSAAAPRTVPALRSLKALRSSATAIGTAAALRDRPR